MFRRSKILTWSFNLLRVRCSRCQFGFRACTSCPNDVDYFPAREGLAYRDVTIHDLSAFAYYKFKVNLIQIITSSQP